MIINDMQKKLCYDVYSQYIKPTTSQELQSTVSTYQMQH